MKRVHWLARPETVRRLWRAFALVLGATVAAELLIARHDELGLEELIGFHAAYGFLACAALIALAKLLGLILKRRDTYYDAD